MDFTKFSDENFDLKNWINSAFNSQKETNQNLDQFVATLITKLQVFIQEINNSIDDTSHQTVQNFPRILREIDVLKQEAFMLKEQMKNARDDLIKVEKNTVNESMKMLLDLDIMRTNMLNVQLALQEADNWTNLTSDLDSLLQTKDMNKISNHIESMQNSLELLEDDSTDYVNRCTLLEDFKNKFETLMSSDIIQAFNLKSVELSKSYVKIFGQMNRLNELKKYYYQCEKVKLLEKQTQLINETNLSLQPINLAVDSITDLVKNWFDYLIEVWHTETQWCKQIFNDSHAIVINLITKCFEEFNKNFKKLIDEFSKLNPKQEAFYLDYFNQFKQEADRFALTIHSSAESSLLLKNSQLNDLLYKLLQQLYEPYRGFIKQYTFLVNRYLQNQLETSIKMSHPDTVECVQLLSNSVAKCFNLIDHEIERCFKFTNGCGFYMLIESFKVFLKSYIEEFKRVVINLKERKQQEASSVSAAFNSPHSGHLVHSSTTSALNTMKINDQNQGQEDWDTFRHFVKIIQIVGELIIKYESLEDTLNKQVHVTFVANVQQNNNQNNPASSSISLLSSSNIQQIQYNLLSIVNYKEYLLDESDRGRLNNLISVIESGDDYSIMKDLIKPLYILSENVHKYAFDIVFAPIRFLLKNISKTIFASKTDKHQQANLQQQQQESSPLFAYAPQEYITKIGQYLLTLPQNFEPFTMQDNANLIVALHKGKLPYLDEKDLSDDITACWLDSIANATSITYVEEILKVQQIPVNLQRQLIIDIEFICSVFEDVGLKDYTSLQHILDLLKVDKENFEDTTKNKQVRLVSALRKMRNL